MGYLDSNGLETQISYIKGYVQAELEDAAYTHPSSEASGSYGPSNNASPDYGETFSVPYITVDSDGHISAASTKTITLPATDNTDTNVTNTLNTTTQFYITGTTSGSTNTGTQVFDTGVYVTSTAGQLGCSSIMLASGIEIY